MIIKILTIFLTLSFTVNAQCDNSLGMHSHNDYENQNPLFNALKNCAKSIEVDIHLYNGDLFVAHDKEEIIKEKTLVNLYLDPLLKILNDTKSEYYFNYELFLLIDIKTEADQTYKKLNEVLNPYREFLTFLDEKNNLKKRNIRIIISGNSPAQSMLDRIDGYCFIDGRTSDIGQNKSSKIFPLISENWYKVLESLTDKENPSLVNAELIELVNKIHNENKLVRFWGIPDDVKHWELQKDIGIDLINTDKVDELNKFLSKK